MWYADWLASNAQAKINAVFRECLIGGYYGIINTTTFAPQTDAFMMTLFARLMGAKVVGAQITWGTKPPHASTNITQMLRAYAHCSRDRSGYSTLLLVNLGSNTSFTVTHPVTHPTAATQRVEWHLTAAGKNPRSKTMLLNGVSLSLPPGSDRMPVMGGKAVDAALPIEVAPASIVFLQSRGGGGDVCA